MIINSNGVNIDTNTQRSDAEIINLIKLNISNVMTRTLLKSFSVNKSVSTAEIVQIGTFDFNDLDMLKYTSLVVEFIGTWSLSASSSGTAYCSLSMYSDSGDSVTVAYMSADKNTTSTVSEFRIVLDGTFPDKRTSDFARTFVSGDAGIEFDGTFSGYVRLDPSNSPTKVSINGTLNIYGIK